MEALSRIPDTKLQFEVFGWGVGYEFFESIQKKCELSFQLHRLHSYGDGSVGTFFRNCRILKKAVEEIHPMLIVLDSDYHFPAYWFSNCPVVSVGQAYDVVERSRDYQFRSISEALRWFFYEKLDAWIQTRFSNHVIVPAFRNFSRQSKKIVKIPLVVRNEFIEKRRVAPTSTLGFLLSGSQLESEKFLAVAKAHNLEVISPACGTTATRAESLDRFDFIITQGGLSSISECMARQKFMIVVPLADHPEQSLNASEVERLGLGLKATIYDLENLSNLVERARHRRRTVRPQVVNCHGADWAARLLIHQVCGQTIH